MSAHAPKDALLHPQPKAAGFAAAPCRADRGHVGDTKEVSVVRTTSEGRSTKRRRTQRPQTPPTALRPGSRGELEAAQNEAEEAAEEEAEIG